jgi:nucleoside-diphosphate-sugar epimerase
MLKKVLITGNNGVLGKNLVEYLHNNFNKEYELVLFDIVQDTEKNGNFETYQGDIRKREDIETIIKDIDIVVHCASASPLYEESEIFDIIINGSANLLECSFTIGNVERFIYISSTSVYGIPEKTPIRESDEVKPYDPYNKSKIKAEAICKEWRKKGKCISILRPRSFIGPYRLGTFGLLYQWASEGRNFPMLGYGRNKYQLLDVEDLCQAIQLMMSADKDKVNDLFNIGAKNFSTIKSDYQAVLDEAGYNKKIICFPTFPVLIILNILEKLKLSPFYKRLYMKLNRDYYIATDKAERKVGYRPKYSNRDALVRNYKWYLNNKETITTSKNVSKGSMSNNSTWDFGILKFLKFFF